MGGAYLWDYKLGVRDLCMERESRKQARSSDVRCSESESMSEHDGGFLTRLV